MTDKLKSLTCPTCNAPISGPGTCSYCGAEVRREVSDDTGRDAAAVSLPTWVEEAKAALARGEKIAAIKIVRMNTGMGLKEAKEIVEGGALDNPRLIEKLDKLSQVSAAAGSADDSAACFPGWIEVATPSGCRPVVDLRMGDEVWAWSAREGKRVSSRVTARLAYPPARIWRIDVNGLAGSVFTTAHHCFLSTEGWVRTRDLCAGQRILTAKGISRYIESVSATGRVEPVYNLHVAFEHTFIVDELVAHSFTNLRRLRCLWHRLLIDGRNEMSLPEITCRR